MAKVSVQHVSTSPAAPDCGAVKDFSIEVADRELVVLAGPRGCGNTSLLRMIAGLEPASQGDILIGEKRVNDLRASERDIAMLFRTDALYPRMTVAENMAYGLKLRKFPAAEIKRRVTEAAAILGIEQILHHRPAKLPPAQRHRAALGRAVARQPKAFLFDHALDAPDPETRVQMRTEIVILHHRLQATMILATHDQEEAMTMAGRIVVMREGAHQQTGAPLALYRAPENLFVAGFLGSPPMNFIRGKLREAGDAIVFKEAGDGVIEIKFTGRPEAKAFAGREVVAGIRPEDIAIVTAPPRPGVSRYKSLLDVVEPTGAETHIHLETGAHRLIGRTAAAIGNEEAGHRVQFEIDPAKVLLFDPETTRRITA